MKKRILFILSSILMCLCLVSCVTVVPHMAAPIISQEGNNITWEKIENASTYQVYINSELMSTQEECLYVFDKTEPGEYKINVKAISSTTDFSDSKLSNTITIVLEAETLLPPFIKLDGNVISWQEVDNATKYEIYVDEVLVATQSELSYEIQVDDYNQHKITVKAVAESTLFAPSEFSNEITYEKQKIQLATPVVSVSKNAVSWQSVEGAGSYEVYVNETLVSTQTEVTFEIAEYGKFNVQVKAIAAEPTTHSDSAMSETTVVEHIAPTDLNKPVYVYNPHLVERYGKCVLGIANQENKEQFSDSYKDTLTNYVDNYLCNILTSTGWQEEDYARYAWQLEVVEYNKEVSWVYGDLPVYRIRLTSGYYLTVTKNNIIGTGGDYISECELGYNDIWQYWQFIPTGGENEYYIYNLGHGYDWGSKTRYLVDTTRSDGGAEIYPMDDGNKDWFPYKVLNVEGVTFAEPQRTDYSGTYFLQNFGTKKLYSLDGNNNYSIDETHKLSDQHYSNVITFEKATDVEHENAYRIRLANGKYLYLGNNYTLQSEDYVEGRTLQIFTILEISGLKGGIKIALIDEYYGIFVDGNDNQVRYFLYNDDNGLVRRQYGSIDWKNHSNNFWTITSFEGQFSLSKPVISIDGTTVSWNAVENAGLYEVFVDGEKVSTQSETQYVVNFEDSAEHIIQVRAISNNQLFSSSELSVEVTYSRSKTQLVVPVLVVTDSVVSWEEVQNAEQYEVYVNDELVSTQSALTYEFVEFGTYKVQVKAISKNSELYIDSSLSDPVTVVLSDLTDLSKPIYVYSLHLEARYTKCVYGIAEATNYNNLPATHQSTLDNHIDNYLYNVETSSSWTDEDYARYAWTLEEIEYNQNVSWVHGELPVYRIRLTNGYYLTTVKNNLIGTGGDYVSYAELGINDIWQYWQFVPTGEENEYYIYNLGHGFDWGSKTRYLVDTTRGDGGAEFYPMDDGNKEWFPFKVLNVDGAQFAEPTYNDYSGTYTISNFKNNLVYTAIDGILRATDRNVSTAIEEDSWTFVKVEGKEVYKIKHSNGQYLCMYNYDLYLTSEEGAHEFFIKEVAGLKGGFKISGALVGNSFCEFIDGNDNQLRYFVYADWEKDTIASRWWGSIDHRNDLGIYWIMNEVK